MGYEDLFHSLAWVIIYFIYGQAFFVMGLAVALQSRRRSALELARSLPWLAAFGIIHGFNEWGHIFIPIQEAVFPPYLHPFFYLFHRFVLTISYFCLAQFGFCLLFPSARRIKGICPIVLILFILWNVLFASLWFFRIAPLNQWFSLGESLARYLLGFPGSVAAFLAMMKQSTALKEQGFVRIVRDLRYGGYAFAIYAVVGGLIVPYAPFFPANIINFDSLLRVTGIPAPVFRSLCGMAQAFFIIRGLEVFEAETQRLIRRMEREKLLSEERERIARELHDGIIQCLYGAGLQLEGAFQSLPPQGEAQRETIQQVIYTLDRAITDLRYYIYDLRSFAEGRVLEGELERLARQPEFKNHLQLEVQFQGQKRSLSPAQIHHLVQIVREALSNVLKHAAALHVVIEVGYGNEELNLSIQDDGQGLRDDESIWHKGRGLSNIRRRVELLQGAMSLESKPGRGTILGIRIPYTEEEDNVPASSDDSG